MERCLKTKTFFSSHHDSVCNVLKVQYFKSHVVDDTLVEWWALLSNCFDFTGACSLRNYYSPQYCTITMGLG